MATMRMFGAAVGEARRSAMAMAPSSLAGLNAHTDTNAAADERLTPA